MSVETKLEVITARSRDGLYRELFERFGSVQYHIVDEKARRRFPLFWKKEYEMKVMLVLQQESAVQAVEEEEKEPPSQQETVQAVLQRLEDSPMERLIRREPADAAKKEGMLRLLGDGFSVLPEEGHSPAAVPQQDLQQLKEAIAMIQQKLGEQEQASSPLFSDLLFGQEERSEKSHR